MAFTPVEFTKDGRTRIADSADVEVQLRFDGWVPTGTPVTFPPFDDRVRALVELKGSATRGALQTVLVPFWAPDEPVAAGAVRVTVDGTTIKRNAAGTTRASFDATEAVLWTVTAGGGTTSASDLTTGTLPPARIADNSLPFTKMTGTLVDAQIPAGIARDIEVAAAVAGLVASAPGTLDTLDELAQALGDDPNFATATSAALGNRVRVDAAQGLTAPQQAQARANIGAGTSSLVVGTAATDAKAGNYQPAVADITGSTVTGRSLLTATDGAAARTAIGAGTSSLVVGPAATDAKAGNYQPAVTDITGSSAVGRSVLTATDAPAARTAIGAGTSSLTLGTSSTTAKAGDYAPPAATAALSGIVELATTAETIAGTDTVRAVTPAGLMATVGDSNKTKVVIPKLEGLMLSGFGHSYLDPTYRPNGIGPAQRYIDRVAGRLGLVLDNNGIQGYHLQDVVVDAIGQRDVTKQWTPGERGIAIIDAVTNDAGTFGGTATALTAWENGFRALIWFLSSDAASVKDDRNAAFTYSGWTDLANGDYYSGTLKQLANTTSGTATFTISTPGKYALAFASLVDASREHEIVMDGTVLKTFTISGGQACAHVGPLGARSYSGYVAPFDVPSGTHTMVLRNKAGSSAAGGTLFDYMSKLNTVDPVQIFVPRAVPWPGGPAQATVDAFNARMTTVAAEFGNVHIVDTLTGFSMASHIGPDGVHLNAAGNEFYADRIVNSIRSWYGV